MKNLRNVITVVLMTIFSITSYAQSNSGVAGEWIVGEQNTIVKIEQNDDVYSGKVIASDNPKAEIGKLMVKDLKEKKGKWKGKLYSAQRNEWFDVEFVPKEKALEVKINVGFFSKTMEWKRK